MKNTKLLAILNKHVNEFINNIKIELESPHDSWFDNFGFPIFSTTSKDFHEQIYFQSYLESYSRKMINSVLKELFDEDVEYKIVWPEFEYKGFYTGYLNSEYEQEFKFEFIDCDNRIGYRYSTFSVQEIDRLCSQGNVDSIVLILWEKEDEAICFGYDDNRIKVILLWELFEELFSELSIDEVRNMYDTFVDGIKKAIEEACSIISLTTLPGFTPSYIHKNRAAVLNAFVKDIKSLSCFFVKNKNYKSIEERSKQLIESYHLPEYFLKNRMEYAFVGDSLYAKSFLTSEYLFRYFVKNPLFDYTPIVSGYIKSIEQLLHAICVSFRNSQKQYFNMSSYTLGSYIYYLKENVTILRSEMQSVINIIVDCLESYRVESRNHLFHKDYFKNWERVITIRNNTLFLYVALLGSAEHALLSRNSSVLGILDEDYDLLFMALDSENAQRYSITINDIEYHDLEKTPRNEGISYDANGLIVNVLSFQKKECDGYSEILLSRNNMPAEVWTEDIYNNKIRQIW